MSKAYKEFPASELPRIQGIDKQIAEWSRVDYECDIAIRALLNDALNLVKNREGLFLKATGSRLHDYKSMALTTPEQVIEEVYTVMENVFTSYRDYSKRMTAKYLEYFDKGQRAQQEVYALNEQYDGWRRFYLVPGGHIHDQYFCSTCHKAGQITEMHWLYDLSGLTLEAAVKKYGHIICSVCYPEAPIDWTRDSHGDDKKRAERCPGTGVYVNEKRRYGSRVYAMCPACESSQLVTSNGGLRAHKPEIDYSCNGSKKAPKEIIDRWEGYCSCCGKKKSLNDGLIERHNIAKADHEARKEETLLRVQQFNLEEYNRSL